MSQCPAIENKSKKKENKKNFSISFQPIVQCPNVPRLKINQEKRIEKEFLNFVSTNRTMSQCPEIENKSKKKRKQKEFLNFVSNNLSMSQCPAIENKSIKKNRKRISQFPFNQFFNVPISRN
jgi:hypothetical protein